MTWRSVQGKHDVPKANALDIGPDLTGPSMSMSTTRPAPKSQDTVLTYPWSSPRRGLLRACFPAASQTEPASEDDGHRPMQPCPADTHSRAARPSSPGEARQSLDGFPRPVPLPKVDGRDGEILTRCSRKGPVGSCA